MPRVAFKMFLDPGRRDEYRRRHDEIWPELETLLSEAGIRNYSIFLDAETNVLFAYLERADNHGMDDLPSHPVMKRWWDYMKDIMVYNPDGSPTAVTIEEVFHME